MQAQVHHNWGSLCYSPPLIDTFWNNIWKQKNGSLFPCSNRFISHITIVFPLQCFITSVAGVMCNKIDTKPTSDLLYFNHLIKNQYFEGKQWLPIVTENSYLQVFCLWIAYIPQPLFIHFLINSVKDLLTDSKLIEMFRGGVYPW